MSPTALSLLLTCLAADAGAEPPRDEADGLLYRWQFNRAHVADRTVKPAFGEREGSIVGPVRVSDDKPEALLLDGKPKVGGRVEIAGGLTEAKLPAAAITVEAWVMLDKTAEWGGLAGAFQHNGGYQKGWLLGYVNRQFSFAVAGKGGKTLTYLKSPTTFHTGFWYHVIGTYDGTEQRLYVDGKLAARSREQHGEIAYPPHGFFTLGAYHDDDELFPMAGRLEQVAVYAKALSEQQVAARFALRKAAFPDIDAVNPGVTDWPTHLRDPRRRGIADEAPVLPLHLQWTYQATHAPRPSWAAEAKADYYHDKYGLEARVTYDRAFQVVGVGNRLWFGSSADDRVRCLDADTGREVWSFVTQGPVRLAPTISDDRVLFGSDDGCVYCLAAKDGAFLWKRRIGPSDRQIAGNERIISAWPVRTDVLVEDGKAYVCAGVFPSQGVWQAVLDVRDGKALETKALGVTAQGYLERVAGKLEVNTGRDPAGAFVHNLKRLGKEVGKEVNTLAAEYPDAFIGAGNLRFGGGNGKLAAFRTEDGAKVWSAEVQGRVCGMALVRGRLLATTDTGRIYCFASEKPAGNPPVVHEPAMMKILSHNPPLERAAVVARRVDAAASAPGYCLVVGGDPWLLYALAEWSPRRPPWRIVGVQFDDDAVAAARRLVDDNGLGAQVSVHHGSADALPYSDWLFNVVIDGSAALGGAPAVKREELLRLVRPHGGVALLGPAESDIIRTGAPAGEGEWTHMYAGPANRACSGETRLAGELQIQWFGPPGPQTMIDRHHRTAAPVYKAGRLFVPGEDRVTAVDAYNGTVLWERALPGSRRIAAFRDCSQLALADEALYVAAADKCLALDPQSGRTLREFALPGLPAEAAYEWGYVACAGDRLVGSAIKRGSIRREQNHKLTLTETHWDFVPAVGSDALAAWTRRDGAPAWTYRARTGLIINQTITIGGDAVYFVESGNPETLKKPIARATMAELLADGAALTALDLKTGQVLWTTADKTLGPIQHNVFAAFADGKLAVVGSRNSGTDKKTATLLYDVHVFDAGNGKRLWSATQDQKQPINGEHGEQERHPAIVGGRLYCEPVAYDLATGKRADWNWPWTSNARRGCGTLSASASGFFFRSDTLQLFDLAADKPRKITTETRPGCWINVLPAGGLLLVPEASSGCSCNFSIQTSLGLIPVAKPAK